MLDADAGAFEEIPLRPSSVTGTEGRLGAMLRARGEELGFDAYVVASILAIALWEVQEERVSLCEEVGLDGPALVAVAARFFPEAAGAVASLGRGTVTRSADEACLLDLLKRFTTSKTRFEYDLAAMIARRAQRPNHLWQDLGLANRGELSRLMGAHFAPLAARNAADMKWKKFLYRLICADASYTLCTAPSCSECDDFDGCFGEETGEALLARVRRNAELGI